MINIIKKLLFQLINDLDAGNSNISEEDGEQIIEMIQKLSRKDEGISKYDACKYLNVSRATFDNLVREGKLPKGKHVSGFKELRFYKKDLNIAIKNIRK